MSTEELAVDIYLTELTSPQLQQSYWSVKELGL